MGKTCFVVMAIGQQKLGNETVSEDDLRRRYKELIKPALLLADDSLEVIRADEVSAQGTITTDILTRLMHNDIVVAEISYLNANVFYELGIRHACRPGTILIRDNAAAGYAPFDVSHQRYVGYENSLSGLQPLAHEFRERLKWFAENPGMPDNHLLEHAKTSRYSFPQYGEETKARKEEGLLDVVAAIVGSETIMNAVFSALDEEGKLPPFLKPMLVAAQKEPATAAKIIGGLIKMGALDTDKLLK